MNASTERPPALNVAPASIGTSTDNDRDRDQAHDSPITTTTTTTATTTSAERLPAHAPADRHLHSDAADDADQGTSQLPRDALGQDLDLKSADQPATEVAFEYLLAVPPRGATNAAATAPAASPATPAPAPAPAAHLHIHSAAIAPESTAATPHRSSPDRSALTDDPFDRDPTPVPLDTPALSRTTTNNTSRSTSRGSLTSSTASYNLLATPSADRATTANAAAYSHNRGQPAIARPSSQQLNDHQAPPSAVRKTSPGLAARLKALGFGTAKKAPSTPQVDSVGRLDEQQLRQLDQKHQAASISSVISRRGRPWKGAGAASASTTSLDSLAPSIVAADSPQLPEIQTPEPLAMDTQKYRLPDHTNGNGTKVTLDTRREHLERIAHPPSPLDVHQPPPPPPPKDTPPTEVTPLDVASPSDYTPGLSSYFTPGHTRPGSIYTLSRASFANQLAQLTSLQLPDAETLSSKVSAIRTAQVAAKALINAADQIRSWISKAQEVIGGLDSEDDVEWAAAGGREGLEEVEAAIARFEELINAYVGAIEELQGRDDISSVPSDDLRRAVSQMEAIIDEWAKIRATLHSVRGQVEIAMEWEELWSNVLGDIQGEMDELSRLVFEMEERRHKSMVAAASGDNVDIGDLETIVEDTPAPGSRLQAPARLSLPPMSPSSPGTPTLSQDDSSLLALFARMQPLRASLDFLPMRLSVFEARAERSFPTACEELDMRRDGLDASYKKLEKDAESLRKELGEDRWVIVFRGAGRQAQKMHESVQRSLLKFREAVDSGMHLTNPPAMMKKVESYEAKKTHYGPAIERVLSIIDKGVQERLTVNGEILRLHSDMQARWESLKIQMRETDAIVEEIHADRRSQHLRDSVSSMLSNDRSTTGSGRETPGSSPPSSVIMSSLGFDPRTPVPSTKGKSPRAGSVPRPSGRRHSSLPAPTSYQSKRTGPRLSTIASSSTTTPVPGGTTPRPGSTMGFRPKWNGSTNVATLDTGHNFKPMSLTTPSPYARTPGTQRSASAVTPSTGGSRLPTFRSSVGRAGSESPKVGETPSRPSHSRLSFRERLASPGPYSQQALAKPRLSTQGSTTGVPGRRHVSMQPSGSETTVEDSQPARPASSLASSSRRSSLLPLPRGKKEGSTGRDSPQLLAAGRSTTSRSSMRKTTPVESKDSKPRWRH
ncbi:karyogamy protein, KAR9 [Purpureocillium lavendulum]|uniref:Karyogamy protein, KAR9 n=1 Tax=Purpureocillium lavendulum TaxID=1247861 RepID=A0AB34G2S4_9HYPO|nr:karyogamy protein, KAR9 [Purpureocillium lavendulum]